MKSTQQLLILLADGKRYSGETLGKQLKISRAGVWKAIHHLKKLGVEIDSVRGKGYQIPDGLDLLNKEKMLMELDPQYCSLLDDLVILEQVDSTNNYLLRHELWSNKKIACFAEHQTQGRGRSGRTWLSPFGHNIYGSLLWHFDKDPGEIIGLSLAIAVGVLRALQHFGIYQQLGLKWPNDILYAGKKLGGILIDVIAESHHRCSIIIGIGINTYLPHCLMKLIDQPCISLQAITQKPVNRNYLCGLLLKHILITLSQFSLQGLTPFLDEWNQFDQLKGKTITLNSGQQQFVGEMQGISERGELILIDKANHRFTFLSGEAAFLRLHSH